MFMDAVIINVTVVGSRAGPSVEELSKATGAIVNKMNATHGSRTICCCIPQSARCPLVFDLGKYKSFTYIRQWHMEVCNIVQPNTVLFMLVGHKCDRKEREVNQYKVEEFASELGAPYIEASAKTGHNVAEAFELLTQRIYQGYLSGEMRLHESWGKIHKNKPEDSNKCGASK